MALPDHDRRSTQGPRLAFAAGLALVAGLVIAAPLRADDATVISVVIENHRFTPSEIHVPAKKPAVLEIENRDATPEEFDSSALKVEKVIAGHDKGSVRLRPLDPGRYRFMGEYHEDTAKGVVIAE
jgi:hypothetical protein